MGGRPLAVRVDLRCGWICGRWIVGCCQPAEAAGRCTTHKREQPRHSRFPVVSPRSHHPEARDSCFLAVSVGQTGAGTARDQRCFGSSRASGGRKRRCGGGALRVKGRRSGRVIHDAPEPIAGEGREVYAGLVRTYVRGADRGLRSQRTVPRRLKCRVGRSVGKRSRPTWPAAFPRRWETDAPGARVPRGGAR